MKLDDKSKSMIFIRYEKGFKGYIFYNPSIISICLIRYVIFEEEKIWNRESSKGKIMFI